MHKVHAQFTANINTREKKFVKNYI